METDVTRAVEEGLLIGRSTATLATKNHLIVGTLREGRSLSQLDLPGFVAAQLLLMADEQSGYAKRTAQDARTARSAAGALRHQHDYRPADVAILEERAAGYARLASELTTLADDETAVAQIAEAARADAWFELSSVIGKRLDLLVSSTDPTYVEKRRGRMATVREIDLQALEPQYWRWN